MAAAVALTERGIPVTVYEGAKRLGGRARAVAYKNGTLDNGQHLLIGAYRQTLRMIETVGVPADRLWRLPLTWQIIDRFSFSAPRVPAPWHLLIGLLRCSGLSVAARLECMRFLTHWRRRKFTLDEDMTVDALLRAQGQSAPVARLLWEPLCVAALNTRPEQASARVFLNVLRDTLDAETSASEMILPRCDLSALFPEPASAYVRARGGRIRLGEPVARVDADADGRAFVLTANSARQSHQVVILAAHPSRAARLVGQLQPMAPVIERIKPLTHEPIVTVYLQYARAPRMPFPMVGFVDACTQWLFDRGAISGHEGLLAAVISARGRHQRYTHHALAQQVHTEIASALSLTDAPRWTQVIEEKRATFACVPNLERPDQRTPMPGLYLAGDYTRSDYPATLESAVQSGLRCADLACEYLAGSK